MDDRELIVKGGATPSPLDDRDYQFTDLITGLGELPSTYVNPYLQEIEPYALNQGNTMECVCCALAHFKWLIEIEQNGNTEMFSPSYLYGNHSWDDAPDNGCYPRCVLSQHIKFGICKFKDFPKWYTHKPMANYEYRQDKEKLDKLAYPYRSSSYYFCTVDEDTLKRAVMLRGAVMICCPVYDTLGYGTSAIINEPKGNYIFGYHEMLIVGWDENGWIVLNSYGAIYDDIDNSTIKRPYMRLSYKYPIIEAQTLVDDINEIKKEEENMFKDIEGHWAEETLKEAVELGVFEGYEDGTLKPDRFLTRAEIAQILKNCGIFELLKNKNL